jgi:hypothetical protein
MNASVSEKKPEPRLRQKQMKKVIERVKAPTPKFFRLLRNIGLGLAAASAAIITAPVALPAIVISVASYIGVAATVISAVSQLTVPESKSNLY